MDSKLKISIVGAGTWGENHAKIYQAHPFAELVAICDQNEERAQKMAAKLGLPQVYRDYHEMFAKSGCDAVAIVTPDFAHADIAIAAAEHKKSMLIEKPLATTREDVFRMVEAIESAGVRVMVDLHNRWSPAFNVAHQSLESGELGELRHAYIRLNDIKWVGTDMLPWAAQSSILWFLGSHSLDTLRWFFKSDVKRVYALSQSGVMSALGVDAVDSYLSTLEFEGGGIAQMENSWIVPNGNPCLNDIKFNMVGTKGMMSLDMSNHNMIQKYTEERTSVPDVVVNHSIFGQPKGFAFESIRSFVDCMLSGRDFYVSLRDAAHTSLALLAVMESAEKRMPVDVVY